MRKGILAIAAAGSVFALTAAGATGFALDSGTSAKVQTASHGVITSIATSKCTGIPALTYAYTTEMLTSITVKGLTCTALNAGFKYQFDVALNALDADPSGGTAYVTGTLADTVGTTVTLTDPFDPATGTPLTSVALDIKVVPAA